MGGGDGDSSRTGKSGKSGSHMSKGPVRSPGSIRSGHSRGRGIGSSDDGLKEVKINPIFLNKAANF
jgi:hypothetical protein